MKVEIMSKILYSSNIDNIDVKARSNINEHQSHNESLKSSSVSLYSRDES